MKTEFLLGLNSGGFHKIALYVHGDAKAQSVPVVCVHGLGRTGRDFDRLGERFATTRALYAPDMAGRGQSDDLPSAESYAFSQYMADITTIFARIGAPQVDFIGTSMGGLLGMILAAHPQTPIRRLVLNDVGPVVPQAALDRIKSYLTLDLPTFAAFAEYEAFLRKICASFGRLSDADWRHMAEVNFRKTADGKWTLPYDPKILIEVQSNAALDLWATYDKVKCPTLLIRGAQSDLLTKEIAQEMTERGPRARLVEIEHAGHAPALMNASEIKLIEDFLNA